jgi:glutathione S-transferase
MVLHEKGLDFETYEVDLANKSEEFLRASPTGKVPVVVVDGDSIYESNVANQYLDEVTRGPRLLPEAPKARAYARIWMASADDHFFPAIFVASVGRERGFSEETGHGGVREAADGTRQPGEAARWPRLSGRGFLPGRRSPRRKLRPPARAGGARRDLPGELPQPQGLDGAVTGRESYKAAV